MNETLNTTYFEESASQLRCPKEGQRATWFREKGINGEEMEKGKQYLWF